MTEPLLSVIVPNYKTPELTKICLRLLRLYSDPGKVRVIVIDNGSGDESLAYLKTLSWITLLERKSIPGEEGFVMHAKSLDEAFAAVDTPFVMIMHTDTFIISPKYLDHLLAPFDNDNVAGAGSWKLETPRPAWLRIAHKLEEKFRHLLGKKNNTQDHYLRSHCAVYRSELIRRYTGGFYDGESAGKMLHRKLEAQGFEMRFFSSDDLGRYIRHLNHATMILNPRTGDRKTAKPSAKKRLGKDLELFRKMLERNDLDQ